MRGEAHGTLPPATRSVFWHRAKIGWSLKSGEHGYACTEKELIARLPKNAVVETNGIAKKRSRLLDHQTEAAPNAAARDASALDPAALRSEAARRCGW